MNVKVLRAILLVKNVEEQDPEGSLLPLAEREAATRTALRQDGVGAAGAADRQATAWRVLGARAELLQRTLTARHPVVTRAVGLESHVASAAWLALPFAFASGVALSLFDSRVRIEILAFPLLGVVLWNLAVYALLAASAMRRHPGLEATGSPPRYGWITWPARWGWQRAAKLIKRSAFYHRPLAAALRRFSDEWWPVAQPLLLLQGKRLFHFASAAVALGLVAGFYLRGLALEYRAGWESTFLGPSQVRALLHVFYGPASAVTQIPLPTGDAAVAALHWRNGQGGGEAAPWIHLMTATAVLFVVVPRMLLAALATWQIARAGRQLTVPESLLPYARQTLGGSDAAPLAQTARLTAYAYRPGPASERGAHHLLQAAFGPDTRIELARGVAYGDEDAFAAPERGPRGDLKILLFNLAATPEAENHGAVLQLVRDRLASTPAHWRTLVLVDESPYLEHMGADESLAPQVEVRRTAWRDFVQQHGLDACTVALATMSAAGAVPQHDVDRVRRSTRGRPA